MSSQDQFKIWNVSPELFVVGGWIPDGIFLCNDGSFTGLLRFLRFYPLWDKDYQTTLLNVGITQPHFSTKLEKHVVHFGFM